MPQPASGIEPSDHASLLERTALATMRVDLGLVPPRARQEAREMLKASGTEFDGARLVDVCLEGRAGDGAAALQRALLALRSRVIGVETAVVRRRPSFLVRWTATLTAKMIFFSIYTVLILVAVVLVRKNWPAIDIYVLSERAWTFVKALLQ